MLSPGSITTSRWNPDSSRTIRNITEFLVNRDPAAGLYSSPSLPEGILCSLVNRLREKRKRKKKAKTSNPSQTTLSSGTWHTTSLGKDHPELNTKAGEIHSCLKWNSPGRRKAMNPIPRNPLKMELYRGLQIKCTCLQYSNAGLELKYCLRVFMEN